MERRADICTDGGTHAKHCYIPCWLCRQWQWLINSLLIKLYLLLYHKTENHSITPNWKKQTWNHYISDHLCTKAAQSQIDVPHRQLVMWMAILYSFYLWRQSCFQFSPMMAWQKKHWLSVRSPSIIQHMCRENNQFYISVRGYILCLVLKIRYFDSLHKAWNWSVKQMWDINSPQLTRWSLIIFTCSIKNILRMWHKPMSHINMF